MPTTKNPTTVAPHRAANSVSPITVTIPKGREISGLGNTTIWKLIGDGTLQTVRVGRRRLIVYESLRRLLTPTDSATIVPQPRRRGRPRKNGNAGAVAP
jgi:excisionase family DNA binding protein